MRRYVVVVALVLCVGWLVGPAAADVSFGSTARFAGMGGAGIAVVDNPVATSSINPAAVALAPRRVSVHMPSIGFHERGASLSDITSAVDDASDADGAIALAKEFGSRDTTLGINLHMAISAHTVNIGLGGEAVARLVPNEEFKAWARGDEDFDVNEAAASVSVDSIAYVPSAAFGWKANTKAPGDVYIGARGKVIRSRHFAQGVVLDIDPETFEPDVVESGPETDISDTGFGMDIGVIYQTVLPKQTTFGLAVTNFLKPSLKGVQQSRAVGVGVATRPKPNVLVAADLINISGVYDDGLKLRVGAEMSVAPKVALRAGYSGKGLCFGVGLFGIDLAFSNKTPLTVSQTLRF